MKIPLIFYFTYWVKNSLLALATGFFLSYVTLYTVFALTPLILLPESSSDTYILAIPIFTFITIFLLGQVNIYRHFWGERRGDFEYFFLENNIGKHMNKVIRKYLGWNELIIFLMDKPNQAISGGWDVLKRLQGIPEMQNKEFQYCINMTASVFSFKEDDNQKEKQFLEKALTLKPNEFLPNFKLAIVLEKEGKTGNAIEQYKISLNDPGIQSNKLKEFIMRQITRVEEVGPSKRPPVQGLRFMSW